MAIDNKTLGRFQLGDIPAAPRGVPQIEVRFDIDANGIVNVSAKNLGTGKEQKITIQGGSGLSDAEIDRMVKEAEENAESDKARKEEVDTRNEAEQYIFAAKKSLDDLKDDATEDEKNAVNNAIEDLQNALKGNDIEEIKSKKDALIQASQSIAVKAYEKVQKQQQTQQDSNDGEDNVVDADYEDIK